MHGLGASCCADRIIRRVEVHDPMCHVHGIDERKRMVRYVPVVCLCLLLLWGSTACALKRGESSALSERGYRISLQVSNTIIFFPDSRFPQTAEVVVRVRDAQGQPVDGIAVLFSVEPSWTQYASLTPAEALTRNGEARAAFEAKTTGVVPVMARVDNVTLGAAITVERRPIPSDAGG
jgi:hypothetical protein